MQKKNEIKSNLNEKLSKQKEVNYMYSNHRINREFIK